MIEIENPANCCGCSACQSICAHDAITMQPDTMGFLYPVVNKDKCIDCGLCEKVCSFHENYALRFNCPQPDAYAARHRNIQEVETSRSGAAFIALSDYILELGGVVYGAGYTDHFRVVHKRATTKEERDEFKGSKYVQSEMNSVFRQIKKDLKDGLVVLFSGTPCQTAGLDSFLNERLKENLYLTDIVCHGVCSPFVWKDYLEFLSSKYDKRITGVNFRDKQLFGWTDNHESFCFEGDKEKKFFKYLFYKPWHFRMSCYKCHYCNTKRPSDITLADFWGWEKIVPTLNVDDKGLSLVIINTEKGRNLFEKIKKDLYTTEVSLKDCLQPNMQKPTPMHRYRISFERDYAAKRFRYVYFKYGEEGWRYKMEQKKWQILNRFSYLKRVYNYFVR